MDVWLWNEGMTVVAHLTRKIQSHYKGYKRICSRLFQRKHALKTKSFKECPIALHHHEQPFVDEFIKLGWPEKSIDGITIYHFDHSRISYEKVDETRKVNPSMVTLEYLRSLVNDDNWGVMTSNYQNE